MLACDKCDRWFHGDCVGVSQVDGTLMSYYHCDDCIENRGAKANEDVTAARKALKKKRKAEEEAARGGDGEYSSESEDDVPLSSLATGAKRKRSKATEKKPVAKAEPKVVPRSQETRDVTAKRLADSLTAEADVTPEAALDVSTAIEALLHATFPDSHKDYASKARMLAFNLKRNGSLRRGVGEGTTTPEQLVAMDARDMADEKLAAATAAREAEALASSTISSTEALQLFPDKFLPTVHSDAAQRSVNARLARAARDGTDGEGESDDGGAGADGEGEAAAEFDVPSFDDFDDGGADDSWASHLAPPPTGPGYMKVEEEEDLCC